MNFRFWCVVLSMWIMVGFGEPVVADQISLERIGEEVIQSAFDQLKAKKSDMNMACLTNAGYATYNRKSTRILYDIISEKSGISMGKANLLPIHTKQCDNLWFAFVQKKSEKELLMTYIPSDEQRIRATEPINIYVDKHQSFEPFQNILGEKAFPIVTIANGWANGIPDDLMYGTLFHDHFCCGVATGYFTVRFIQQHIPLKNKEKYTYIGAPGWCQDDYIIHYLNLTPGKHGYYIMEYPWNRPWKTSDQVYTGLGGIIIRFDPVSNTGEAHLLQFNWQEDKFKRFIGDSELKLDWKNQPWLHVWYNKFFLKNFHKPDDFVSVLKVKELKNKEDFHKLINMGANPLKEILGEDKTWQ